MAEGLQRLVWLSWHDLFVTDEELCGAPLRSADDGNEPTYLLARDQSQLSARRTRQHSPVRIFLLADLSGIFQDKNGSRLHLFGDPFAQNAQFSDHVPSLGPFKKPCASPYL